MHIYIHTYIHTYITFITYVLHSSLVDYLAQVILAKNYPTTFYCIFQLVWVPMTTMQNIRVCFWGFYKTLFYKGPPFG